MALLPPSAMPDARRILAARSLRAFADGFVSVLLPIYLLDLGFTPIAVGVIATATLLGSAALTLWVGRLTVRFGQRRLLLAASVLMAATGLGFASAEAFWPLLVIAFVGTVNPSSGDVSVFLPLEHSVLAESVAAADRTALFARYSLVGALMSAIGTLFAALPELAHEGLGVESRPALKAMFLLYGMIGIAGGLLYRGVEWRPVTAAPGREALGASRGIVYRLAALFSIDAFGGGFFVQSMLALWLFQRFGLSISATAQVFFITNLFAAASFLAAVPVARRFGLINTMVFTHLPSNLCLIAVPFVDAAWLAVALLCARSLLSQMDVPTRTSYVMAVVTPAERAAAAGVTAVPRSLASAVSPSIAGWMLSLTSFGWPLLVGGVLKAGYDLALLWLFRNTIPPEERRGD